MFEKLTGTGTSFGTGSATASGSIAGKPLAGGTYSATVTTDWSHAADNGHGGSCAPATATLALVDSASSANTLSESVTGKTCAVASNDRNIAYVFRGASTVTGAAGTLAGVSGAGRVLLVEKTDGTVDGFAFAGFRGAIEHAFVSYAKHDAKGCDGGRGTSARRQASPEADGAPTHHLPGRRPRLAGSPVTCRMPRIGTRREGE